MFSEEEVEGNSHFRKKMKSLSSKKAQVNTMAPAIILLVIAAFFLIMGVVMLQSLRDVDVIRDVYSTTTRNETLTTVDNSTGELLAGASDRGSNDFTVLYATNATGGEVLDSSNYTVSSTGYFISAEGSYYTDQNINVSYTHNYGDEAFASSNTTLVGVGTFADFWEIIVLAIVLSLVIGLLLVMFGKRRGR